MIAKWEVLLSRGGYVILDIPLLVKARNWCNPKDSNDKFLPSSHQSYGSIGPVVTEVGRSDNYASEFDLEADSSLS